MILCIFILFRSYPTHVHLEVWEVGQEGDISPHRMTADLDQCNCSTWYITIVFREIQRRQLVIYLLILSRYYTRDANISWNHWNHYKL